MQTFRRLAFMLGAVLFCAAPALSADRLGHTMIWPRARILPEGWATAGFRELGVGLGQGLQIVYVPAGPSNGHVGLGVKKAHERNHAWGLGLSDSWDGLAGYYVVAGTVDNSAFSVGVNWAVIGTTHLGLFFSFEDPLTRNALLMLEVATDFVAGGTEAGLGFRIGFPDVPELKMDLGYLPTSDYFWYDLSFTFNFDEDNHHGRGKAKGRHKH